MKAKKTLIFLWISLSFFSLSLIVFFVKIALLYYEFQTTSSTLSPNDFIRFEYNFVIELFAYIMFGIPALLLELSGIRSVYRILKYNPHGVSRICLLISAILSFSAFVFQTLMFAGLLDFTKDSGSIKLQETVLLLTGWPVVVVSFGLGINRKKQDDWFFPNVPIIYAGQKISSIPRKQNSFTALVMSFHFQCGFYFIYDTRCRG